MQCVELHVDKCERKLMMIIMMRELLSLFHTWSIRYSEGIRCAPDLEEVPDDVILVQRLFLGTQQTTYPCLVGNGDWVLGVTRRIMKLL